MSIKDFHDSPYDEPPYTDLDPVEAWCADHLVGALEQAFDSKPFVESLKDELVRKINSLDNGYADYAKCHGIDQAIIMMVKDL